MSWEELLKFSSININSEYWNGNTSRAGVANMRFDILRKNENRKK